MNAAAGNSGGENVATALEALEAGRAICVGNLTIVVTESIPRGHKIALQAIRAGEPVVKYGSPIGTASMDIPKGVHVHTHNVASARGPGDLQPAHAASAARIAEPPHSEAPEDSEPSASEPAATPGPRRQR